MNMRWAAVVLVALTCAAETNPGVPPRSAPSDYPVQQSQLGTTVAAAVLSSAEVRNRFASDINRGYIVVEVAVYPAEGGAEVSASDFALRYGGQTLLRPVSAQTVAGVLHRKAQPAAKPSRSGSDVTVYPTASVGYESGRGGIYDPSTGRTRNGGWYGGGGVGVAVGQAGNYPSGPARASTERDRSTMQAELEDQALPAGRASKPVAGYLYFPVPDSNKRKSVAYELQYDAPQGRLRLPFPPVGN